MNISKYVHTLEIKKIVYKDLDLLEQPTFIYNSLHVHLCPNSMFVVKPSMPIIQQSPP